MLSYFPWKVDGLMPLDKVMLRAWYSPRMAGGMTPFEALPVLADELVATCPRQGRRRPGARPVLLLHHRADARLCQRPGRRSGGRQALGQGHDEGIRFGRSEMSYFLGIAYLEGTTVQRDPTQAVRWLERAATMGNRGAQAKLGAFKQ